MLTTCPCGLRGKDFLESEPGPCELSAECVFAALVSSALGFVSLPLHWASSVFSFHIQLLPNWDSAVLGLCLTKGAKTRLLQPGYIRALAPDMSRESVISLVMSHCSKYKKLWTSVTAQSLLATTILDSFFLF